MRSAIFYQLANDEIIRLIIDPPPPGAYLGEVTSAAADGAAFGGLTGLAFLRDVARNERTVFCADGAGHRVQAIRITLDSEQRPKSTTLCWDHGRVGTAGARAEDELDWPADCALSADQTELWIADSKNHRGAVTDQTHAFVWHTI